MDVELEPEMVEEMAAAHHNMTLSVLEYCLEHGMKPDGYFMIEDLAHNRGMLFSPASWRNILKPYYKKLGLFLRENGIHFLMHCCGNAELIFADLIEAGVQVMQPLQVSARMDVLSLREKYQNRLAFWGNIDIRKLSEDDDFWFNEVLPKINLAKSGGYIYHSDHSVPCNIDFDQYKEFIDKIKAVRFC
jgi:uroporphyrinogen decarboxylase